MIQTDLIGLDALAGDAAGQVAAVRTTVGATIGITGETGVSSKRKLVCVRPDDSGSYVQPADPAGVCLLPDCAEFGVLDGAANARTTVTMVAWRYDSTGRTVSAGEGYDLNLQALGDVAVNEIGAADGRLTAELVAPAEGVAVGETAGFELSPEFGAAATLRFGPALAFGGAALVGGRSAAVPLAANDYGGGRFPAEVEVEYLGARRGLTYVRSASALANDSVFALCRAGGEGWRVPGIGELAGLFADGGAGYLTDSGAAGAEATVYANDILPGARRGALIPFAAGLASDGAAVSDGGVSHYADAVQGDGRAQAFRVLTADGGGVLVSLSLDDGRGVCVLAGDGYERPAVLAGAEVLDLAGAGSAEFERGTDGDGGVSSCWCFGLAERARRVGGCSDGRGGFAFGGVEGGGGEFVCGGGFGGGRRGLGGWDFAVASACVRGAGFDAGALSAGGGYGDAVGDGFGSGVDAPVGGGVCGGGVCRDSASVWGRGG